MEDVLSEYQRPYEPLRPQVCMDEISVQLLSDVPGREPLPVVPGLGLGHCAKEDYEYVREGVANIFLGFEPLAGRRHATVTERRTKLDWAYWARELVDVHYPEAERVVLVMDNLNTHSPASLYEAFEPAEAKRIADKLEIHYTPKHGSWLNMAEIELSVLRGQCLDRRMPDIPTVAYEVGAWEWDRNEGHSSVDWRFTTQDARIKLKHLYPIIDD
jgi:hypothetical protein